MSMFDKPLSVLDISASGLTAERIKMGVIASLCWTLALQVLRQKE